MAKETRTVHVKVTSNVSSIGKETSKATKQATGLKGALKGVPTFIVNGKYRVILGADSGISDAKSMADLINYLADK